MTSHQAFGLGLSADDVLFRGLASTAAQVRRQIDEVRHGADASLRTLRILLCGGTGVGKSTLLNALAGEAIASTGGRRPTTTGFTAYVHRHDVDPWLHGLSEIRVIQHDRDELQGKALIDSPDADSAVIEHRAMLEGALSAADLIILVITEEKYLSSAILDLVTAHRQGREFCCVFNKIDRVIDGDVVEDFRRVMASQGFPGLPVFSVSALAAFRRGTQDPEAGQMRQLCGFIAEGLTKRRIAHITRSNLAVRASAAARTIRSAMPAGWEETPGAWRQRCALAIAAHFSDLAGGLRRHVLRDEELAQVISGTRGASFGGVFGVFSALVYAVRRVLPSDGRTEESVERALRRRIEDLWGGDHGSDAFIREGFSLAAAELGLHSREVRGLVDAHAREETTLVLISTRLPHLVRREVEGFTTPLGGIWNALANAPVWAWIAYWTVRTVSRVLGGLSPEWDAFPGAAIVGVLILGLQWSVVHRILRGFGRRRARSLISRVLAQLETELLSLYGDVLDAVERRIGRDVAAIRRELDTLDAIAAGDLSGPPSASVSEQ